jgi:hypothetical protein
VYIDSRYLGKGIYSHFDEHGDVSGSDSVRRHDYETALGDLKLRKNLKNEDWYAIGIHLSNRKEQGKESEVLWNSRPMAPKKVRKEVLRNRKLKKFYPRKSELISLSSSLPFVQW